MGLVLFGACLELSVVKPQYEHTTSEEIGEFLHHKKRWTSAVQPSNLRKNRSFHPENQDFPRSSLIYRIPFLEISEVPKIARKKVKNNIKYHNNI